MVSPTSTTPQTPALSYAESAKKAQGVKLASQVAQKPLSNPPRQPPAPVLDSKKAGLNSSTLETPLTSLADLSLHDVPSSGANPSAPTSPSASTSHTSTTIPIDSLPSGIVSSTSTKAVPPPNVWNQRIQQRAQTRPPPRPPQSLPHMTQSHVLRVPSPTRDPPSTSSSSRQPDVPVSSVQTPASPSVLNGASGTSSTSSPSTGTTPSLRREPLPHPPPVDDAETWPEVGKSQTYAGKPQRVSNGYTGPVEVKDVEEKDSDGLSPSHPGTPRKSEKTKWIVIPPEELQATADSLHPPRSLAPSRSHSQLGAQNSQTRNAAASGSGSMQSSQVPSKTASGRTSTSHSRAHSPSSMASSPQHPGRGRQLPVDARGTQAPEQQQQHLPQDNSPRAYSDMTLSTPVPYGPTSRDVYAFGNLPSQSPSTQTYVSQQPSAPAQPPPTHYPPALQLNPTHPQQPYASSVSPYPQPYPLHTPSDRYGPTPTQPLPPGWAAPEHYVYPSYGYPPYAQPHPMIYWPSNLPLDMRQDGRAMYPPYPPVQQPQQIVPQPHVSEDDGAPSGGEEPVTHPALPPPTMIARPPPPQESDAVAGYRAVKPILDAGSGWEESTRGRRDMIFGSVGAPGGSKSPSPSPGQRSEAQPAAIDSQPANEKSERAVATFSIGVSPGEAGPSHVRSRTRSQPRLSRAENLPESSEPYVTAEVKVIDLTSPETKWEFGTANRPQDEYVQDDPSRSELVEPQSLSHAPPVPSKATLDVSLLFSGPLQESMLPIVPTEPPAELHHPYPQPHHHLPYALPHQIHPPPPPPPQEDLQVQTGPGPYPVHQSQSQPLSSSSADGFEVKDFGYGFGRASGSGHAMSTREDRFVREREWDRNRDPEREPHFWRPRRGSGSYSGHHDRGGFNGRRGRANGFGRGVSGRGFGRGGFRHNQRHQHQHQHQQQHQHQHQQQQPQPPQPHPHVPQQPQQQQQQAPPFAATTPSQAFQPLQPPTPPPQSAVDVSQGQYLTTSIQQPYLPHGFDAYQAPVPLSYPPHPNASMTSSAVPVHPVPRPLSNISYSADPTRFFLLGQLEYYLSAQNMVTDLFLRQQMDSRGWIPVSLLASFNRVRQLTLDPQLVRDVLALSSIVELCDDCVRMGGDEWRRFVLPDAPTSTVEVEGTEAEGEVDREQYDHEHVEEYADVEEEEEEEEIEIVMDRELGPTWVNPSS